MKIAFLVGNFPLLSETFVINQIIGLISRGHEVDIYAIHTDNFKTHPDVEKYHLLARTHYEPKIPENQLLRLLKALWLII